MRVAYAGRPTALLPYWGAIDGGFFARQGLLVELEENADLAASLARLQGGQIDLYLTPLSDALVAEMAGGGDFVIIGGTPELAVIATRRYLASREVIVERFLRGVLEGIHAVQTRPDFARDLLVRAAGWSPEDATAALAGGSGPSQRVPYVAAEDLVPLLVTSAGQEPRAANLEPNSLLDQSVLRRLESSGFVAALYRA
jgi:ABC-type nitrate/sulfonate/bicarbonate transport system substrate-binding protein